MSEYVLSADAESDLYTIWEFIAQDDIDAPTVGSRSSFRSSRHSPGTLVWAIAATTSHAFLFCSGPLAHI
jgi:hypothetical protein